MQPLVRARISKGKPTIRSCNGSNIPTLTTISSGVTTGNLVSNGGKAPTPVLSQSRNANENESGKFTSTPGNPEENMDSQKFNDRPTTLLGGSSHGTLRSTSFSGEVNRSSGDCVVDTRHDEAISRSLPENLSIVSPTLHAVLEKPDDKYVASSSGINTAAGDVSPDENIPHGTNDWITAGKPVYTGDQASLVNYPIEEFLGLS